jgi:hypothetical protein
LLPRAGLTGVKLGPVLQIACEHGGPGD